MTSSDVNVVPATNLLARNIAICAARDPADWGAPPLALPSLDDLLAWSSIYDYIIISDGVVMNGT